MMPFLKKENYIERARTQTIVSSDEALKKNLDIANDTGVFWISALAWQCTSEIFRNA